MYKYIARSLHGFRCFKITYIRLRVHVDSRLQHSHFFWTWCDWGQICNMPMDQRVDMYSSKDPQWVHPKWIQARSDGDSLEIHFNVGEFQAPKRRSNFDQPELNSPKRESISIRKLPLPSNLCLEMRRPTAIRLNLMDKPVSQKRLPGDIQES